MGSTNFTPNYSLPQFIGTDKPAWLTDVNGAFSNIDTAIKNAADDAAAASNAASTASGVATGAATLAGTLDTQINTPVTGLAAVVSGNTSDISNITTTIGTTPLTTVAQTLTGAIEEVKGSIPSTTGLLSLQATNTLSVTYDGTTTTASAMNTVYTQLATVFSNLQAGEYVKLVSATPSAAIGSLYAKEATMFNTVPTGAWFGNDIVGAANISMLTAVFRASSFSRRGTLTSTAPYVAIADESSVTPTSGDTCSLTYELYKQY